MHLEDEKQVTSPAAREILDICAAGSYKSPSGRVVPIDRDQAHSESGTRLYSPEQVALLREAGRSKDSFSTLVEVVDATTQEAARSVAHRKDVALLNFASARNPGGGFFSGARAQEEELCRCSGLYRTLVTQSQYYEHNRSQRTVLYSDFAIYSPKVPFIRVATHEPFLEHPFLVSVITMPAPNAGAMARDEAHSIAHLRSTFERRWANVLAIAEHNRDAVLVLGAWGCGAFRNEPAMVAETVRSVLLSPRFAGVFEHILFAIPGAGRSRENLRAFQAVFGA